jgi:DNA-damage-inducible protein J
MTKSSVITARIDPALKQDTEQILNELGLTPSQAITLFYRQITLNDGLPFPVNLPNAKTKRALRDAQERYRLENFDTVDELLEDLEA